MKETPLFDLRASGYALRFSLVTAEGRQWPAARVDAEAPPFRGSFQSSLDEMDYSFFRELLQLLREMRER